MQLINEVGREHTLARALRPVLHAYDYILIDCQPSLGLLTVNALACAHGVIIPLAAEYFSLRGVALLVDTIDKVQERINPDLSVDGRAGHHVRRPHRARPRGGRPCCDQRFGDTVFDTDHLPHGEVPGDHRRRRADHLLRADLSGRAGLPGARARSDRAMTGDPAATGNCRTRRWVRIGRHRPRGDPGDGSGGRRSFHVRLDNFDGPFDLLLQLISQRRMDVTEVALHQVTDDFIGAHPARWATTGTWTR